jgi:Spy/CpxP family protein refolding chaperone
MSLFRCCALGFVLALIAVVFAGNRAEGQVKIERQQIQIQPIFGRGASGPLVPADVQEKLSLTKEQKEKLEKIEKEFADKSKDAEAKVKEAREKAIQDKNREAFAKVREMTQDLQKMRGEYTDKVKGVLTDEQKKKFEEATQAGRRPGVRPVPPNIQPIRPFGRGDARPDLNSREVQEKLGLTAEQKEKLEKLQKEFESKSNEVLTEEQKKKLEELKKQPARPTLPLRRPNPDK